MLSDLQITRAGRSRLEDVDFDHLGFGECFADHMFSMWYEDGRWQRPEILPYGPVSMEPGCAMLHYAQAVFEGLKVFRGADGALRLFRPDANARRLVESCRRMCIPPPEESVLIEAVEALARIDRDWVPSRRGQALYVRPMVFSAETHLDVRPSERFRYLVITGPVRAYFDEGMNAVALKVEETYVRAAPGGTGAIKAAGNYGASLLPAALARDAGYAQVLWLDSAEHRYVEEVGAMNIFFRIGDTVVTPDLRGSILPGVTRDSVIRLLRDDGAAVEERQISIDEVATGVRSGVLSEAFGAGTAAIIAPVGRLAWRDEELVINENRAGPLTRALYDRLTGIQLGEVEDRYGWTRVVAPEPAEAAASG